MEAAHRRLYVARPLGGRCGLQQDQPKRQGEVAKASHGAPVLAFPLFNTPQALYGAPQWGVTTYVRSAATRLRRGCTAESAGGMARRARRPCRALTAGSTRIISSMRAAAKRAASGRLSYARQVWI